MKQTIQTALHDFSTRDQLGEFLNDLGLTGKGVEVGTFHADYAVKILAKWKGHLFCIDPWKNQPKEIYFDGSNLHDLNAMWEFVRGRLAKFPRCTLKRMLSLNGVGLFDDYELDFVYLDGNHSLASVRADLLAWWPKVKIGGLLCGHDFFVRYDHETNSDAQTAVCELADVIGVRPHVTWCTSWWFIKTEEADERFKAACLAGQLTPPIFSNNSGLDIAVVMPVARFDWNLAKQHVQWMAQMANVGQGQESYRFTAFCSPALTDGQREELVKACATKNIDFRAVKADKVKELGYFGTTNQMFRGALEYCETTYPGSAMLWTEADAVPLRPTWFQEIRNEYLTCNRPFMGDFFRGGDIPHMTGNAVYHPRWRLYAPVIAKLEKEEFGWDTICAHETMPRAHFAKSIQQIWRPPLPFTAKWMKENVRPQAVLFHQCKDGSLVNLLALQQGLPAIPLEKALCESTYQTQPHGDPHKQLEYTRLFLPNPPIVFPKPVAPPKAVLITPPPAAVVPAADIPPSISGQTEENMEILIITYKKDIEFLHYCIASIEKNATGFAGVTLMIPSAEKGLYDWVKAPIKVNYFDETPDRGMMHHELLVCRADELCPNASTILHLDADCMFWRAVTPKDYIINRKPLLVRERYADIAPRNPNRLGWRDRVKNATGLMPEFETMVRHPNVYRREIYAKVRELVEGHTHQEFDAYVLSCKNTFPQAFAEFPTLGAVAIKHYPERYTFIDYNHDQDALSLGVDPKKTNFQYLYRPKRDGVAEFWSHGGVARYKQQAEDFLAGRLPKYLVK